MKAVLHRANSRAYFNHGWLKTHHTFSFADYYDPDRINFGALRVLNDDSIDAGTGFDIHPHRNMEIISIPLKGALRHGDSMGNTSVLHSGEIQVMSAGTGVYHSEFNDKDDTNTEFLQIWVIPDRMSVEPRYENANIKDLLRPNEISDIVTPYPGNGKGLWIYQDAWFSIGELSKDSVHTYKLHSDKSLGVYVFMIDGSISIDDVRLTKRDGIGLYDMKDFSFNVNEKSTVLFIEVPDLKD
ncbi:MAG: pirin family protein [Culturomica sp.]|jgi:redox-sensitive bicupin YhaK (pirin superfamily)|nr:pirin family protein [Culturomica sp.]